MQLSMPDRVISCPNRNGAKVSPEQNSGPQGTPEPQGGSAYQQWDKVMWMAPDVALTLLIPNCRCVQVQELN